MKDGSKSKVESGNKDLCGGSTGKKHNEETNNKDVTFIVLRKKDKCTQVKELKKWFASSKATDGMLHYCVKRGGMTKKKDGRHIPNIFMGTGKYDNKHGVGIILNKKWRQRIFDTEHINERAVTAIVLNRQRIKLMSVYFHHSGYADHHIEKMFKTMETHTENCKRYVLIVGGDFNAELERGHGTECTSVGRHTPRGKQKEVAG